MPRPSGTWTFTDGRFRNAAGQFIPDDALFGTANALRVSTDDAFELRHRVEFDGPGGILMARDHVAGAATPEWLRTMARGSVRMPCLTCGVTVGLKDLVMTSEHSRDWGKQP